MTTATFPPDLGDAESLRMEKRAGLRERIAEGQLVTEHRDAVARKIAELDAVLGEAADIHLEACEPLQTELKALEADAISRVRSRQEPDEAADNRRGELRDEIERHNKSLRDTKSRIEAERNPLLVEQAKLSHQAATYPFEIALAHPDYANPKLLIEQFCLSQRVLWLGNRREFAAEKLRAADHIAANKHDQFSQRDASLAEGRKAKWIRELELCDAEIETANRELAKLHRQIIDE